MRSIRVIDIGTRAGARAESRSRGHCGGRCGGGDVVVVVVIVRPLGIYRVVVISGSPRSKVNLPWRKLGSEE